MSDEVRAQGKDSLGFLFILVRGERVGYAEGSAGLTQPGSPVREPALRNDSRLVFGIPLGAKEGGLTALPGVSRGDQGNR